MPGGGRARASRRAAAGVGRPARAARPRGVRLRPRDRCRRTLRHGAPAGARADPVSFARPLLLLALGLLPLWWWLRAKRLAGLAGTQMSDVRSAAGAAERLWVARLPVTLRSACLGAWIIAAAGPRIGAARSETRSEGISIVLAVDISGSMQAEDFAPANRIDVAKQTAIEFVRARTSDRIGLVAFAGQALTQVPITTDNAVLEQALRELHPGMLEDGTAIGTAIGTAANRLRRAPGRSKVLVLLTDGLNNKGTVDPRTAGQAAAALGIKTSVIRVRARGHVRRAGCVMTFDAPVVLALAPLIGGAVWFAAAWARRVRIRRAALWSQETVRQALAAGRLGPTALAVAAFLGVVALAGPRWGEERIVAETRGLSVVLAVDISRSMLAEDATPNRLRRALREARRLVQDLDGDRVGLIAFAGSSYIMSPLSIDGSALTLYLDALDPDMASQGGTGLAPALRQGGELLQASSELTDRVLVVFTDGEAHDSLPPITAQAQRLKAAGIRLILVAEGGRNPSRIPVRDDHGGLLGYQKDEEGRLIETARRDDMLGAAADAAQGTLVAADLPDQAGAVRDLVASYRRARASETRTEQSRPRAWLPLMLGVVLLVAQAASRRTAALVGLAFACLALPSAGPAH